MNTPTIRSLSALVFAAALILAPAVAGAASATTTAGLSVTPVTKATGPQFQANLSLGSGGADVMRLQQYLNTHGCPVAQTGPGSYQHETSYFGPATKAALECFQKDTGVIPTTGNLGPMTRQYISTLP